MGAPRVRLEGTARQGAGGSISRHLTSKAEARQPHKHICMSVSRGFTMVEAFAVLAIIVILTAVSIPSIRSGMSHLKFARALDDFVDQVEFARGQAAARNRSYRLLVTKTQAGTNGVVNLTEGVGTVCTPANFTKNGSSPEPILNVRDIDFTAKHPWVVVDSVEPQSMETTGLCFKPDGRVLEISSTGGVVLAPPAGYSSGEAVYTLSLLANGGVVSGTSRVVVVPYNGVPRVEVP